MTTFRSVPNDVIADGTKFDQCGHRRRGGQLVCLECSPFPATDMAHSMSIEAKAPGATLFDWVASTNLPRLARDIEATLQADGWTVRIV